MNHFTSKYADSISGVLSGFDRLVFRGNLRRLCFVEGMSAYLQFRKVLLKDFGQHADQITERIKQASLSQVQSLGRPVRYLASCLVSKEETARRIAREQGIKEGPVCVLTSVEPCHGFDIFRNRDAKRLELVSRTRKCLHLYHYMFHPVFGFMNARIQTWFPFRIQVCINGREWLARQMEQEGIGYERRDNCFVRLSDFDRAQELMDEQLRVHWPSLLTEIARTLNPLHEELFGEFCADYYWSTYQSEWATDIVFNDPDMLRRLYPMLLRHGMGALGSLDVMRFLGRKPGLNGCLPPAFLGEVTSDIKGRPEGVRIKHRVNSNSVKAYDKAYTKESAVLRVETTMNNEADFKVYRPKEGDSGGVLEWRSLRKGIADLYRRAEVCQAANGRYLDALASVDDSVTLQELLEKNKVTTPVEWNGKGVRALHPFEPKDTALLAAVSRGEFSINGLRNRDLQRLLFTGEASSPEERKRRSAWVTRQLRLLRAHGLISKVPHTHRYQVTSLGRQIITAVLTARETPIRQLLPKAA